MKKYDYHYVVSKNNSPKEFKRACKLVEKAYPQAEKKKLAVDVDGSTVQVYRLDEKKMVVLDAYDYGYVFVNSDIDLSAIFEHTGKKPSQFSSQSLLQYA